MEEEEAGSISWRSFSHPPALPQERWNHPPASFLLVLQGLALGARVGLHLMVTHDKAESSSLSPHAVGSAGSMLHGITVPSAQLSASYHLLGGCELMASSHPPWSIESASP